MFNPSGFVKRKLSKDELCSAFDLPLGVRQVFKEAGALPFVNHIPAKVVWYVGSMLVKGWKSGQEKTEELVVVPDKGIAVPALVQKKGDEQDMKAVKSDDASIIKELWNQPAKEDFSFSWYDNKHASLESNPTSLRILTQSLNVIFTRGVKYDPN